MEKVNMAVSYDNGIIISLNETFEGFIHLQDLSWLKKIPHPSKLFQYDQVIEVKILEIDH